ncbi:LOW QUALITY PROTEIN: toll-like receptor 12 [Ctenodactylus gundi]
MSGHLLLPALLLSLPPTTGWTLTSNCLVTEGSQLFLVSRFFGPCRLDSRLPLLASCHSVTNLTQVSQAVSHVEGLCLAGSISSLPQNACSNFPRLKVLGLNLHLTQVLPGALQDLGQLQRLMFIAFPAKEYLFLPSDDFSYLRALQQLDFLGPCLARNSSVLPPNLQRLSVTQSCLQDVGELADIFPDLVQDLSSGFAWTLDVLNLSLNKRLKMARPGALHGLKVRSLRLDHTKMEAAAVTGLGLQQLHVLSMGYTPTAALLAEAVAHFELQELNVGATRIRHVTLEALASCHSLSSSGLQSSGLTKLPLGFLAAMPRLQRLNLAGNQLQNVTLCMNETGAVSGLWTLNLSNNGLRTLPRAAFSCLPHLRELLLEGNQLVHLNSQIFQGLWRLETLNLNKNPLAHLGEGLAPLPALITLDLLDMDISLSPTWSFQGTENLQNLSLQLSSASAGVTLSLPMRLKSLELHAGSGMKHWVLPNVFPVLQTLTLKGWGLKLGTQNISKIFPALQQLFLLGSSLEALCSQGTSSFFLWNLPRLRSLTVMDGDGRNSRPCCITGLSSLQELKLQAVQSRTQSRPVQLQELVGELPRLQVLQLVHRGLETLSATAFQGLGNLQVLVLDWEKGLVLDDSLQEHSLWVPCSVYILFSFLACQCANGWVGPWQERTPRTYMYISQKHMCPAKAGSRSRSPLFSFLWSHCPQTLGLELVGSFVLLLLLISLPLLQEARNSWVLYLQALFRAWLQGLRGRKDEGKRFLYDVFVSHCREDQGWVVQELLPALEGFPPDGLALCLCLPERDFEPGKDVADNVADSMVNSRVTICVMSHQALHTARCHLELRLATSLLLAAPYPPVLLLVFLELISHHQLPRYHRLAWLLRRGDYCLWPVEPESKDGFWVWLRSRLKQAGLGQTGGTCVRG